MNSIGFKELRRNNNNHNHQMCLKKLTSKTKVIKLVIPGGIIRDIIKLITMVAKVVGITKEEGVVIINRIIRTIKTRMTTKTMSRVL